VKHDTLYIVFAKTAETGCGGWTVVNKFGEVVIKNPNGSPYHSCSDGEAFRLAQMQARIVERMPGMYTLIGGWVMFNRTRKASKGGPTAVTRGRGRDKH
jgi:hypothetical protein